MDDRGWLILPEWAGVTLARYAGDRAHPPRDRLAALAGAARALESLHRAEIPWAGEARHRLAHGDATLRNVNHDPETGRARWFDFDTAHEPRIGPIARRADDLRAVLYSAIETLADLPVPEIHDAVRSAYRDDAPWDRLRADLARGPIHFSPFHFAQANPPLERRRGLEAAIRSGRPG